MTLNTSSLETRSAKWSVLAAMASFLLSVPSPSSLYEVPHGTWKTKINFVGLQRHQKSLPKFQPLFPTPTRTDSTLSLRSDTGSSDADGHGDHAPDGVEGLGVRWTRSVGRDRVHL